MTAFLLLMFISGAPWGILQVLAWSGMIISYTQESGLAEGVSQTFDGQHPCELCRALEEVRVRQAETSEDGNKDKEVPPTELRELKYFARQKCLRFEREADWQLAIAVYLKPRTAGLGPATPPPRAG